MKCLACNGRGTKGIPSYIEFCLECQGAGQVDGQTYIRQNMERTKKFWTPAERAGLKAMGDCLDMQSDPEECAVGMIQAYVKAARGIKEED